MTGFPNPYQAYYKGLQLEADRNPSRAADIYHEIISNWMKGLSVDAELLTYVAKRFLLSDNLSNESTNLSRKFSRKILSQDNSYHLYAIKKACEKKEWENATKHLEDLLLLNPRSFSSAWIYGRFTVHMR